MKLPFSMGILQGAGIGIEAASTYPPAWNKVKQLQWIYQTLKKTQSTSKNPDDMIVFPEMWNTPYNSLFFATYAEKISDQGTIFQPNLLGNYMNEISNKVKEIFCKESTPDEALIEIKELIEIFNKTNSSQKLDPFEHLSTFAISCLARVMNTFIISGSITEKNDKGDLFNTSSVFSPEGLLLCRFQKMHLFNMEIPGEFTFFESDCLKPGNQIVVFDHPKAKIGIAICRDLRYFELAQIMKERGASILVYPGCFNKYTGPKYWELLLRARAVDTNCFVIGCGGLPPVPGGNKKDYSSHGHSMIISPSGEKQLDMEMKSGYSSHTFDLEEVNTCDTIIPLLSTRRSDVYQLTTSPTEGKY